MQKLTTCNRTSGQNENNDQHYEVRCHYMHSCTSKYISQNAPFTLFVALLLLEIAAQSAGLKMEPCREKQIYMLR